MTEAGRQAGRERGRQEAGRPKCRGRDTDRVERDVIVASTIGMAPIIMATARRPMCVAGGSAP